MFSNDEHWQSLIDSLLKEALEDGRTDHLPGAGRPLDLREDPYTPREMRMAYKILQDNDIAPEWIMAGKALESALAVLRERLQNVVNRYNEAVAAGDRHAQDALTTHLQALESPIKDYNRDVLGYNLKVPPGIAHRPLFNLHRELTRLKNSR